MRLLAKWTARAKRSSVFAVKGGPSALLACERFLRRRPSGTLFRDAPAGARSCGCQVLLRDRLVPGRLTGASRTAPGVLPGIHTLPPPRPWGGKDGKMFDKGEQYLRAPTNSKRLLLCALGV